MPTPFVKLLKRVLMLTAILPLVACVKPMGFGETDGVCAVFRPISWSQSDTDRTIAEVKAHNAAVKAVCGAS